MAAMLLAVFRCRSGPAVAVTGRAKGPVLVSQFAGPPGHPRSTPGLRDACAVWIRCPRDHIRALGPLGLAKTAPPWAFSLPSGA